MKLMFVSDIHGIRKYLELIYDIYFVEKPTEIIFLGDIYSYGYDKEDNISDLLDKFYNKVVIRGNCDSEYDVMTSSFNFLESYQFDAFNKKVFCSHGHKYNISRYPDTYFDIMVYGHVHIGFIEKKDNKIFLNPGSISYPRGGSTNSYMIMDEKGIYLKDLEQNVIDKLLW